MLRARTVLVTLIAAGLGVAVALAGSGGPSAGRVVLSEHPVRVTTTPGAADRVAVGMSGCLAAACHGAPAGAALEGKLDEHTWQRSGSVWTAADPHTAAYSLLTDRPRRVMKVTAAAIMAKYAPGTKATDDARCVACHTNPALATAEAMADANRVALREQGVNCEACHGNAGAWVQPHTAWKDDRTKSYEAVGMTPLYDLGERAMNCAGCHVGAPAAGGLPVRDMNHDMIAAGHPRLDFDFAEYQRRLPKHWQEKDRTQPKSPAREVNEAKVWYVGRVAHAEAACKLLADRAARAEANDRRTPWPEFAEFNCASCHHNLRVPASGDSHDDWRTSDAYLAGRAPGVPPWQTIWPLTSAPGLENPARTGSRLAGVVEAMETPRPAKTGAARPPADSAAKALAEMRVRLVKESDAAVFAEAKAIFPKVSPRVPEWDSTRQLFFGLAALEYRGGTPTDATVKKYQIGVSAFRSPKSDAEKWKGVSEALDALAAPRP